MLLFKFRKDRFERPQIAQKSYALPLKTWGLKDWVKQIYWSTPPLTTGVIEKFPTKKSVVLVPTTAHELKDWPLAHWLRLIDLMPQTSFLVLGGPADQNCTQLENHAPERVTNLAGQLSLLESCQQVANCLALVAADTGLLHVADASGVPAIGLYGPVMCCYPAFTTTQVLEVDLACRPCSRIGEGYCTHPELKKCLQDIRPEKVARVLTNILQNQTT
jgi:heptosyltransferase-2